MNRIKLTILLRICFIIFECSYIANAVLIPAGTEIVNQSTITFEDESGTIHKTTTNLVILKIRQVFSANLEGDSTLVGIAGKSVSFFHSLENTGNGTDIYCIKVDNLTNDSGDFSLIRVIQDINNNGFEDQSDPIIASGSSSYSSTIKLDAGQKVYFIVSADIPDSANNGNKFDLILNVNAKNGSNFCQNNSVTDIGLNSDNKNDTNIDQVIITSQAIITAAKESTYQPNNNGTDDDTILYKITIRNIGSLPARDIIINDILPENTTYQSNSIQTQSDFIVTPDVDDGYNGIDGHKPFHNGENPGVISGEIDYLEANNEIIFTYILEIDDTAVGGTVIENSVIIKGDLDENNSTDEPEVESNKTSQTVHKSYGVEITDTGIGALPNVNDGGDDDSVLNDQQYIDNIFQGENPYFTHIITNNGNSTDTFSLSISNISFPANTVFRFYYEGKNTFLLDTNSDSIPDTGLIQPKESINIVVGAILPTTFSGSGPYKATISAQSVNNPDTIDSSEDILEKIVSNNVDIANTINSNGLLNEIDADPKTQITTIKTIKSDESAIFDLYAANEGNQKDSYQISIWMDESASVSPPKTWKINFENDSGMIISSTPEIQPGEIFYFKARISFLEKMTPQLIPIFFKVYSTVTNSFDIKQDAIQIMASYEITINPNNENTVSPGGSVEYLHTVQNIGNSSSTVKISVQSQSLMSNSIMLPQIYNGVELSSYKNIDNFSVGDKVTIFDLSENSWQDISILSDNSGGTAILLEPGDSIGLKVIVMSPTEIPFSSIDVLIVQAKILENNSTVICTDVTTASVTQLKVIKKGSKDPNCDLNMSSINDFLVSNIMANPGQCIVWQLIVINNSSEPVCKVTLYDKAPAFTYVQDSPIIYFQPQPADDSFCSVSNNEIQCCVGNPIDINKDGVTENHCLKAGERAEIRFRVEIE